MCVGKCPQVRAGLTKREKTRGEGLVLGPWGIRSGVRRGLP